ncbi:EAL domain-containing protein [Marinobacteraceae bacterium S3BR75-40.1]
MSVSGRQDIKYQAGFWLLATLAYLALTWVGHQLTLPGFHLPLLHLGAGLLLGLVLTRGASALPVVVVGTLITAVDTGTQNSALIGSTYLAGGLAGVTTALYPLLAALLLWKSARPEPDILRNFRSYLWMLGATAVAALASSLILLILPPNAPVATSTSDCILLYWFSFSIGSLIVVPPLLALQSIPSLRELFKRPLDWLAWVVVFAGIALLATSQDRQMVFLLMPLMAWAATRFSLPGSLIAIALSNAVMITLIINASPPLGNLHALTILLALFWTLLATGYYIRALLEDRKRVEASLENTVEERTRELQVKNFELQDEIFVRQQAERSFRRSSSHYRALVETASNPIIVVDENMQIRQWNGAAEHLFGYSRDDAVGQDLLHAFIPDAYTDEMGWKITKLLSSGILKESVETEVYAFDGTVHNMLWNINQLLDDDEASGRQLILIGQDITEIRATQDKLHFLAHYDALTATANRRLFEDRCRQAIESAMRYGYQSALISLDVDHFKRINDSLGHDAGDDLLKEIANRLRKSVRAEDTISRMGGDEFSILLNRVNGIEGCEKVARGILDSITRPIPVRGGELVITSSIGITMAPDDGQRYEDLLKNADMAMYRAKKAGRNNMQFFSSEMNDEMQRQMQIERELRVAIQSGHLDMHYQPVVDITTGRVAALEALLRWYHPEKGLLTPALFLDVAEQTGQLVQLGEWVCYNVCYQSRAIQAMSKHPTPVSMNLSARQYHHPQLVSALERIIRETQVDPQLIGLEVDERVLSERLEEAIPILQRIKKLGVQLILDRFGSGLSSVRLLRELPFDQVKIDRTLLQDSADDPSAAAIASTLIDLAHQMSLTVVANGVETEQQFSMLRKAGCRMMQGHLFCRATPSNEVADLFRRLREGASLVVASQIDLLEE